MAVEVSEAINFIGFYLSMSVLAFILESMLSCGFDSLSVGLATGIEMLMPLRESLEAALMVLRALKVVVAVVAVVAATDAVFVVVVVVDEIALDDLRFEQLLLEHGKLSPKKLLLLLFALRLLLRMSRLELFSLLKLS